jgi:hypothetical protein
MTTVDSRHLRLASQLTPHRQRYTPRIPQRLQGVVTHPLTLCDRGCLGHNWRDLRNGNAAQTWGFSYGSSSPLSPCSEWVRSTLKSVRDESVLVLQVRANSRHSRGVWGTSQLSRDAGRLGTLAIRCGAALVNFFESCRPPIWSRRQVPQTLSSGHRVRLQYPPSSSS